MGITHLVSAISGGKVDNPRFVTRAAAFRTAGLRAILMTVIAARAENDLDAAPLAEENPTL
ncbi:MAG: hypothetical protein OXF56_20700 [Rhodobacteraceae bacterium]|nr:hypothetical protein [Paracoccaceae bacterium]